MRVSAGGGDLPSSTWRPGREAVVVPREVVAVPGKGNTSFGPRPGEIKRRQLAEAAEKRQMEASSRGIKNAYSVEQKKKKQEEIERRIAASCPGGEGRLRWQVG
ncbi:small VCP/p97-interacting protein isoform X4 [Parus major]|uniref:small VCP/p97-interacting protein isoform X4 n=1 Tax=Parus major TaxID=9157 RepID=UPI0014442C5F|nr:small VCP/p97-interacting protein isoform X4 [Parus major]